MGHLIVYAIFGIIGCLLPKKTKQRMMDEEGAEWYAERKKQNAISRTK